MQPVPQPNSYNYPYPMLASHRPYLERLLEGFNYCLSPQQLPQNMTIRNYMDEELWIPIGALYKLPVLDSLYLSEIMIPFVTESLHNYSQETLEVDLSRGMVRPRWALQSSVFISKVDPNATTEQVYSLLDDIRLAVSHHPNPYEYRNITIAKHSPNAWSIGFKSPSAGAYAAMAMRTKCINGSMVLPMACMHINPPKASYIYAGIVIMEVDAVCYGAPFIPHEFVPYYSENPEHIDMLYRKTFSQYVAPAYMVYVPGNDFTPWESGHWTESNYSDERNGRQGEGLYSDSGSRESTFKSSRSSRHGTNSHRAFHRSGARREARATTGDRIKNRQLSETTGSDGDRESIESSESARGNARTHGEQRLSPGVKSRDRSAQQQDQCGLNDGVKESGASGCHDHVLRGQNGNGTNAEPAVASKGSGKVDDVAETDGPNWETDSDSVIKFPNPELDKLPSPSFATKVNTNTNKTNRDEEGREAQVSGADMVGEGDSGSKISEGRAENGVAQRPTARNRNGSRRGRNSRRRDQRRRRSKDSANGDRILHGRKQQTETDEEWQVISYRKRLERNG